MNVGEVVKKEIKVVIEGQTLKFRVYKYIVLGAFYGALYAWKGAEVTLYTFVISIIIALVIHFFLRWKTEGWTRAWGPYRPR